MIRPVNDMRSVTARPRADGDATVLARPVVLFDLDGTLVDSVPDITASVNVVLGRDDLPPLGPDVVRQLVGDGARVLVERAYAHHGRDAPPDALDRFRADYDLRCTDETRPYDGVPELLDRLVAAGRRLAVVTNKPTDFSEKVLSALGLRDRLAAVVGPELVRRRKPSPEHVVDALARLGAQPSEAVLVGDGTTDVASARDAGAATVAVLWGYRSREQLAPERPDAFAADVAELGRLLLGGAGEAE